MKKKIFMFLLSLFFILPGTVLLTACGGGGDNYQGPSQGPSGGQSGSGIVLDIAEGSIDFCLTDEISFPVLDTDEILSVWELEYGKTYSVFVEDFYTINSVQIYFDDEPLEMTYYYSNNHHVRHFDNEPRKEAKFTLPVPDDPEERHWLKCTATEEEFTIKFVSDENEYTDEQKEVLSNYSFTGLEGKDFASLIDSDYSITATYKEITNYGIEYVCQKPIGWYDMHYCALDGYSENYCPTISYIGGPGHNKFLLRVDFFDFAFNGLGNTEVCITFDEAEEYGFGISSYEDADFNNPSVSVGSIISVSKEIWRPTDTESTKLYIEPYAGVNLSNVEAYIFEEKMTIKTDATSGKQYFEIPAGKMPVDYYYGTAGSFCGYNPNEFYIKLENVDMSGSDLITSLVASSNNADVVCSAGGAFYHRINGVSYIKPENQGFEFGLEYVTGTPSSLKINGTTFELKNGVRNYMAYDETLSGDESQDSYKWGNEFYHKIEVGSKEVDLSVYFNDDKTIRSIHIEFYVSDNTTVELIY